MPKIRFLSEEIRGKIAAGEVIERPASVVKELVENAFDAGASYIRLGIREGGIKEIQVYDDGEGMDPADLKICYKHFTTSKIKTLSDIFKIVTYGFRGEALASIAQVSKLTIISKTLEQEIGFQIEVEGGKELDFKPANLKKGTLVIVKNLFYNLPARKAFLKSPKTETQKILEIIKGLSLTHPEIRYEVKTLDEKEKTLFYWEGGSITGLLKKITGIEEEKFKIEWVEAIPYEVELVLTDTSLTFSHTKYLYILVNKRWLKDEKLNKLVLSVIKTFYGSLGFPAGVISIKVPYHLVDVNVHPAKWEVRFKDEKRVFQALNSAFAKFFKKGSYVYETLKKKTEFTLKTKEDLPVEYKSVKDHDNIENFIGISKDLVIPSFEKYTSFKFIGTFKNNYLLVEKDEELYVIDQHALSERIIYEDLLKKCQSGGSQLLIFPQVLKVPVQEVDVKTKLVTLKEMGFELELLEEKVILKKIPSGFNEEIKEILEEVLIGEFSDPESLKQEILAKYACKTARKKGEVFSEADIFDMLYKLFSFDLKICPHGRPIYFKLTCFEIDKKLRRI